MTIAADLRLVLRQARDLRERLVENLRTARFDADDVDMQTYNNMIALAAGRVPGDAVLAAMEPMPDANLRTYVSLMQIPPAPTVTKRLESHLAKFINHLEILLGESADTPKPDRAAREVLREEQGSDVRAILDHLETLRQQAAHVPAVEPLDFGFVADPRLQEVLRRDSIEAQVAFAAGAFKACSLVAGGIVEGMLLDKLQQPDVISLSEYAKATAQFPNLGGEINWDRVSLTQLIGAARDLKLLKATALRFAEGARDLRDRVHPKAEVRDGIRPEREEAELLLALVKLINRDLPQSPLQHTGS